MTIKILCIVVVVLICPFAWAHGIHGPGRDFIEASSGSAPALFIYLAAKHMITGYDHLLFLVGVIFYLRDLRTVAVFVSLFALGHTITLISGVLFDFGVNPFLIDAIIGLSVAYKGFDNLGGFKTLFGESPNELVAVFIFGPFHGLGLATKLQDLGLPSDRWLVPNLVSFNVGVELGQLAALIVMLLLLRALPGRVRGSRVGTFINVALMIAGFALMTYQLALYTNA